MFTADASRPSLTSAQSRRPTQNPPRQFYNKLVHAKLINKKLIIFYTNMPAVN